MADGEKEENRHKNRYRNNLPCEYIIFDSFWNKCFTNVYQVIAMHINWFGNQFNVATMLERKKESVEKNNTKSEQNIPKL